MVRKLAISINITYNYGFVVFWKHSITALFAVATMMLASTLLAPKAHALELVPKNTLKGSIPPVCSSSNFLSLGQNSCNEPQQKPSLFITSQLIPTKTPKPTIKPSKTSFVPGYIVTSTATLSAQNLFELVNKYREKISLTPFEKDSKVCSVAESRKDEMQQEIFITHALHQGFYAKNLPYFATENLIYQHTEEAALTWWLNSPIHRSAIQGNYKYACGVCNGEVCDMIFTNYEKKAFSLTIIAKLETT